jgi:RNA polymerase sigma-70 factor (ECF subfamily)
MTKSATPVTDLDGELIAECKSDDVTVSQAAFAALMARHRDGVFNFVRHALSVRGVDTQAEAPDITQETFVRALGALPRFRHGAPFEPWLYAIAANLCRDHLRRVRRHQRLENEFHDTTPPRFGDDPAQVAEQREAQHRLLQAISDLPDEQRLVVILRHGHDKSYRDIAQILNLPVSVVEHRLRAARGRLREVLRDDFLSETKTSSKGGAR